MKYFIIVLVFILPIYKSYAQDVDVQKATYLLIKVNDSLKYAGRGSGFIVKGNKGYYLVSARHIFNNDSINTVSFIRPTYETSNTALRIYNGLNTDSFISTVWLKTEFKRKIRYRWLEIDNKVMDIGIIKLENPAQVFIDNAYPLSSLDTSFHAVDNEQCILVGYPSSMDKRTTMGQWLRG